MNNKQCRIPFRKLCSFSSPTVFLYDVISIDFIYEPKTKSNFFFNFDPLNMYFLAIKRQNFWKIWAIETIATRKKSTKQKFIYRKKAPQIGKHSFLNFFNYKENRVYPVDNFCSRNKYVFHIVDVESLADESNQRSHEWTNRLKVINWNIEKKNIVMSRTKKKLVFFDKEISRDTKKNPKYQIKNRINCERCLQPVNHPPVPVSVFLYLCVCLCLSSVIIVTPYCVHIDH